MHTARVLLLALLFTRGLVFAQDDGDAASRSSHQTAASDVDVPVDSLVGAAQRLSATGRAEDADRAAVLPLAYLYVRSGREALAAPLIQRSYVHADDMLSQGQEPWNAYYQYAALALLEGNRRRAIRWLRTAHLAGMPGPTLIETDPLLFALHGDPEFQEIVDRLRWREAEIRKRLAAREGL